MSRTAFAVWPELLSVAVIERLSGDEVAELGVPEIGWWHTLISPYSHTVEGAPSFALFHRAKGGPRQISAARFDVTEILG